MKKTGWLMLMLLLMLAVVASGQDTTRTNQLLNRKVTQKIIGTVKRTPPPDSVVVERSEEMYLPYEGKIIRKIIIHQVGFDRVITDTTRNIKTFTTKAANKLHNDTKAWVIRDNLFIKEGKPLNPYRVADNERYLRDLDFILDSRIFVLPPSEDSDSVDLLVMTRDIFSLGGGFYPQTATRYRYRLQDVNLFGMGQRLSVGGIYDYNATPQKGLELLYEKINLLGTFINTSVGFTQIDNGRSVGLENEYSYFLRLNRPLFNPFTRWTGALELSENWSRNIFVKSENEFASYRYSIKDIWAGYSFGLKHLHVSTREDRNRSFVGIRAFEQHFTELPASWALLNNRNLYADRVTVLAQVGLFKQNFYKTRFVYGFGRTEDMPYGYRISFTGGWEKEAGLERPYIGVDAVISTVNRNGTFYTYTMKLGNYLNLGLVEDGLAQFGVSRYSRLYIMGKLKVRHELQLNYTSQINQRIKERVGITDLNAIHGFRPDSLFGANRLNLKTESVVFTPLKILGFAVAPVASIDLAYLGQENKPLLRKSNFYSGYSLGIRARNENLIFRTVEGRLFYYPTVVETLEHWRAEFRVNLRIKYPTTLVTAPATVYNP